MYYIFSIDDNILHMSKAYGTLEDAKEQLRNIPKPRKILRQRFIDGSHR